MAAMKSGWLVLLPFPGSWLLLHQIYVSNKNTKMAFAGHIPHDFW